MVKKLGGPRRKRHLQHAHESILKNHLVTVRRGLDGVVALRKTRFVLTVEVEMPGEERDEQNDDGLENFLPARTDKLFDGFMARIIGVFAPELQ